MIRRFGCLGLILGTLGLVLGACSGLSLAFSDVPEEIETAAEGIASLTPPEGFEFEFTASAMDYTVVSYKSDQENSHLYLLQSSNPADAGKLEDALAQLAPGAYDPQTRLEVVESQPVSLRGQETTLVISEGINGEGQTYRQAAVPFDGNGGPAMLIYLTRIENWNIQVVNQLITTIQ